MTKRIFRAKLNNGEWIYWDIFGNLTTVYGKRHSITLKTARGSTMYYRVEQLCQHIIKDTITESIGARDINKRVIFDGDIALLEFDDGKKQSEVIKWNPEFLCWCMQYGDCEPDPLCPDEFKELSLTVIGNIFENKNLLEGDNEN